MTQYKTREETIRALKAIADGYKWGVEGLGFGDVIWVENPDYQSDDGSSPRLVIETKG